MENGPRKQYCCKKGCLIRGRVFETNRLSDLKRHERSEKHLEIKHDIETSIPCKHEGCTYSTPDLSNLKKHELTHEKEARRLQCKHKGCTYSTTDLSILKKNMN